jgi:hypothetical protein
MGYFNPLWRISKGLTGEEVVDLLDTTFGKDRPAVSPDGDLKINGSTVALVYREGNTFEVQIAR